MRLLSLAAIAFAFCAQGVRNPAAAQAADTQAPLTATAAGPSIDGFRTAKFGMTETQLRETIAADFKISASARHGN